jgi:amino acid adenylation domain-containing protein
MSSNNSVSNDSLQYKLLDALKQNAERPVFLFGETYFNYRQLSNRVSQLQFYFLKNNPGAQSIGIIANNDFDTYAAIVACICSGITYVPIEPTHPDERNNHVVELSSLDIIYCSDPASLSKNFYQQHVLKILPQVFETNNFQEPFLKSSSNPVYILFTSGTTGLPKGVPITVQNLSAFVFNIDRIGIKVTNEDRFLQAFDLTFDASVFSYLIPLLYGACIYPLRKGPVKYIPAIELIETNAITHVFTVPSFIGYLEPFFKEINLPTVKHWIFCGEALQTKHVEGWQRCLPNAKIFNHYGPTEATVFCTSYLCNSEVIKDENGIICIGKPFDGTFFVLFDDGNNPVNENFTIGELCIAGRQLTSGYVNNARENQVKFFEYDGLIYYRTGDLCLKDSSGDYFFKGRNDSQIKINGFRVELCEIEYVAQKINGVKEAVAIFDNLEGSDRIILFLVGEVMFAKSEVLSFLEKDLPDYMLPAEVTFIKGIPYNLNGKTDKKRLMKIYSQSLEP